MEQEEKYITTVVTCSLCKDVISSKHRHDFVMCSCGSVGVDGGSDYFRMVGNIHEESKRITTLSPHQEIREYMYRGSRGHSGKEPLCWIKLKDMEDDHLEKVLWYNQDIGIQDHPFNQVYKNEIEYRKGL